MMTSDCEKAESLTVLVPVYNDAELLEGTVQAICETLENSDFPYVILILDDGSTDWAPDLESSLAAQRHVSVVHSHPNRGKGSVLNRAFPAVESTWTVIVDGDGEYAARDIPALIEALREGRGDWVFGSRYGFGRPRPAQYTAAYLANRLFNVWFRVLSGIRFHDILTGLYAFRTDLLEGVHLRETRFAYTPELIWKVERLHHPRWHEVPVKYRFRTYKEGKKIHWWETFTILTAMVKYKYAPLDRPGRQI